MKLLLLNLFFFSFAIANAQSVQCTGDTCVAVLGDNATIKRVVRTVRNAKVKNVLAPAGKKSFGFSTANGTMIVPFMYDAAQPFSKGYAAVALDGLHGIIDSTGKVVVPIKYKTLSGLSEGAAFYSNSKKADGIVTLAGKEFPLDAQLGDISTQSSTTINTYVDTYRLVYEWTGYNYGLNFSEGLAVVHNERYICMVVTKEGKHLFTSIYDVSDCKDGMFRLRKRISDGVYKYGFADKTGKTVIQPIYHSATDFKDGKATVTSGNPKIPVTKVIDKTGAVLK